MTKSKFPQRLVVHAFRRLAKAELEDVRAFARLTTELVVSEAKKHAAEVANTLSLLPEDEREAYFENNADDYDLMVKRFPNQQQQSIVVLAYTVLESRLVAAAKILLHVNETGLALKDLAGDSPFQKSRKVITRVAGFDIGSEIWQGVEAYRLVRNAIVHSAGDLGSEPPPLVKQLLLNNARDIRYSEIEGLLIEPAFVFGFLEKADALIDAVCDKWLDAAVAA